MWPMAPVAHAWSSGPALHLCIQSGLAVGVSLDRESWCKEHSQKLEAQKQVEQNENKPVPLFLSFAVE